MQSSRYCFTQNILSEIQIPPKGILSHTLYNDEQAKIILFGFAAGEELTAHTAPMPATIQILSGEVTLTAGGESVVEADVETIGLEPGKQLLADFGYQIPQRALLRDVEFIDGANMLARRYQRVSFGHGVRIWNRDRVLAGDPDSVIAGLAKRAGVQG